MDKHDEKKNETQTGDIDVIQFLSTLVSMELKSPEVQDRFIRPVISWVISGSMPYVATFILALVVLNFFTTMAAISLIFYIRRS